MTTAGTGTGTAGRLSRGWTNLVSQLSGASDINEFHRAMLDLQCKIVAAEYGALWLPDPSGEWRAVEVWPANLAEAGQDSPILALLREGARNGAQRGSSLVLKVEQEGIENTPGIGAHLFTTAMRVQGKVVALTTVVADCRDPQVLQTTVPMREMAAGLYELFQARQMAVAQEREASRTRRAVSLLASSQSGKGFVGSCLNMVNELARQLQCARVSIGWIRGRGIRLMAMSDTEDVKRHSDQVLMLESAMAECLDQEQPIVHPAPADAEPLLAEAVVHTHKRLSASGAGRSVVSIPLRVDDQWVGVVTLERAEQPFDAETIRFLQLVSDVIAPHLLDRRRANRWLVGHAVQSFKDTAAYLVGPRHVIWKLVAMLVLATMSYVVFGTWSYRVSAPFVLEAEAKRIMPAPYETTLDSVMVRPGDFVEPGQMLARLDTTDLRYELAEAQSQFKLAALERAQYMAEGKQSEAQQAQAQQEAMAARIARLEHKISQAQIISPIRGVVLVGDWRDKLGGIVEQGTPMFEVAPLEHIIAVVRVSESDIHQLQQQQARSNGPITGELATRAEPARGFDIVVERIVPLAQPHNGANVFEVRSRILAPENWLRPGLEGRARLDVGDRPIYWIATHRAVAAARLWLWW